MKIIQYAEKAARDVCDALGVDPTDEQSQAVTNAIQESLVNALREAEEHHTKAAHDCCEADLDMAHKIQAKIRSANAALIVNLNSLR